MTQAWARGILKGMTINSLSPGKPAGSSSAPGLPWKLNKWGRLGIFILYAFAAYFVPRAYELNDKHYLVLSDYMTGHERLPFQRRVLPVILLQQMEKIPIPARVMRGRRGIFEHADSIDMFAIDLISFVVASYFCVKLYRKAMPQGIFGLLVFPIFVYTAVWSYILHTEQNYYYQYDMLALAFFTAGVYCIYTRRFWPLALIMLVGTLNRETTLFLIPIFVLDATAPARIADWRKIPWVKTAVLCVVWLGVKLLLSRFYVNNDRSEDYFRFRENIPRIAPNHWAEIVGGCGFLLPVVWLLRKHVPNPRIAAWLVIVPVWFAVMVAYGVLTETRVYGELCGVVAVAATMMMDGYVASTYPRPLNC